jgi:hypothetical protein
MGSKIKTVAIMLFAVAFVALMGVLLQVILSQGKQSISTPLTQYNIMTQLREGELYYGGYIQDLMNNNIIYIDNKVITNIKSIDPDTQYTYQKSTRVTSETKDRLYFIS